MGGARAESAITAYEDDTGAWFVTDGTSGHGRRLLFTVGEYAARSMPPARAQQGACPPIARAAVPDWQIHIEPVAAGLGIDPNLIRAVIWAESRCNPRARSPKGAQGLMQLMPATAREYGVTDAFDPLQNIRAGARYLRDLMGLFSGNLELALAAYNAGPRSVFDARMRIPAFRETRAYVPAVLARVAALGRPAP
jgi:soluble lytic murein transglycosylase-like protein